MKATIGSALSAQRLLLHVTACGLAALTGTNSLAAAGCEALSGLTLPDTTITLAESVGAGAFRPPAGSAAPFANLPAFCRVAGTIAPTGDSSIRFEVWMPESNWNGKFMGVGGAALTGAIYYDLPPGIRTAPGLAGGLAAGYATAGTDTGHVGTSPLASDWAIGHPQKVIDFGHRAVHEMTVKAKAIIAAFYGRTPQYSYFNGCSTGGRQGLAEAQLYPADYDGILAGAPANYMTHLLASSLWIARAVHKDPANHVPTSFLGPLNGAVMAACDALDGVTDGVLQDPRRCKFNPQVLLCSGTSTSNCLTAAQLDGLMKVYAGPRNPGNGDVIFPGLAPGGELAWAGWLTGTSLNVLHFLAGNGAFRDLMFEDPKWDWTTFDFDRNLAVAAAKVVGIINNTNPDLRAFRALGHKLIQYHGWNDQAVSPLNSINYYDSVLSAMGTLLQTDSESALNDTRGYYRLFMVPGMAHCGVPGTDGLDAISALDQWVTTGKAPEAIIHSRVMNGRVDRTRPVCPYPQVARWTGSGSTDDQASFVCAAPDER